MELVQQQGFNVMGLKLMVIRKKIFDWKLTVGLGLIASISSITAVLAQDSKLRPRPSERRIEERRREEDRRRDEDRRLEDESRRERGREDRDVRNEVRAREFLSVEQLRRLPESGRIDPWKIRFSQDYISERFKNGRKLDEVVADIRSGKLDPSSLPAIRIVERDGLTFSLDNRRLWVHQQLNLPIAYKKLEVVPSKELFKFSTRNNGQTIDVKRK